MPPNDESFSSEEQKLQDLALLLIAGCLTSDHLRRGIEDSQLNRLVVKGGFIEALQVACEQIRPNVTEEPSFMIELTAIEGKLSRLIAEPSYRRL